MASTEPILNIDNTKIILTIILIVLLPTIYLTEQNNVDYNLSLARIDMKVNLTNTTLYYPELSLTDCKIDGYTIRQEDIINKNFYIKSTINNSQSSIFIIPLFLSKLSEPIILKNVNVEGGGSFILNKLDNIESMNITNYIYLASFNKTYTTTYEYNNIFYTIEVYSIPLNAQIMRVYGLENELNMPIYEYELGPRETAINNIKNRKPKINIYKKWIIRIILLIILLVVGISFFKVKISIKYT